jgi:hypothetical protein
MRAAITALLIGNILFFIVLITGLVTVALGPE